MAKMGRSLIKSQYSSLLHVVSQKLMPSRITRFGLFLSFVVQHPDVSYSKISLQCGKHILLYY